MAQENGFGQIVLADREGVKVFTESKKQPLTLTMTLEDGTVIMGGPSKVDMPVGVKCTHMLMNWSNKGKFYVPKEIKVLDPWEGCDGVPLRPHDIMMKEFDLVMPDRPVDLIVIYRRLGK